MYKKKTTIREKIVLRWRTCPRLVTLPNGTTFTARYERISRKQLPINIHVKNARKIRPRNIKIETGLMVPARKKVRFVPISATQDRVRRILKKNVTMKKSQSGKGLASNLTKIGLTMGSKAVNSSFGKKKINKDKAQNKINKKISGSLFS